MAYTDPSGLRCTDDGEEFWWASEVNDGLLFVLDDDTLRVRQRAEDSWITEQTKYDCVVDALCDSPGVGGQVSFECSSGFQRVGCPTSEDLERFPLQYRPKHPKKGPVAIWIGDNVTGPTAEFVGARTGRCIFWVSVAAGSGVVAAAGIVYPPALLLQSGFIHLSSTSLTATAGSFE